MGMCAPPGERIENLDPLVGRKDCGKMLNSCRPSRRSAGVRGRRTRRGQGPHTRRPARSAASHLKRTNRRCWAPAPCSDYFTHAPSSMSEDEVPRGDSSDYDEGGDSWDEEEDLKDYRKGGYHPVKINDKFSSDRYRVMSKLGWGHFSTVWLAWDSLGKKAVVIKIQKSASRYQEAARDEVTLLKQVSGSRDAKRQCLVMLEDHFVHKGINGTHHVMAFEVLGPTLLSLIKQTGYHGLPLAVVRRLAVCTLVALRHLHEELSIIHTDLKPENILCATPRRSCMR